MITRLSFFLLLVALGTTSLAPQGSARKISISRIPDPRDFFSGSPARDKSILWKIHLALHLVKHPELNERQVQIILDAISLSTPEFFTHSSDTPAKIRADEALQSLSRRALNAFTQNEATELFGDLAGPRATKDILKMYFDISAFPVNERKASFRSASPNTKSHLWRTHLALFLVKRPKLNERQKEIILAAISLASPEHFEIRSADSAWKPTERNPLRSLEEEIVEAFSLEDAAKIFATLGDDTESANHGPTCETPAMLSSITFKPLGSSSPDKPWIGRIVAQDKEKEKKKEKETATEEQKSCDCSTKSDYCPIFDTCNAGSCKTTDSGCGTLWSYPCNGTCR